MEGWVKLHRKLCKWEWYTDVNTCHLFIHLLLKANHERAKWRGIQLEKGQLLTGRDSLSAETGLSPKSVRTSLVKLKSASQVAIESNNQYSIITIVNWGEYQLDGQQEGQRGASEGPARGQPMGHRQEDKNDKNNKKEVEYTLGEIFEEKQLEDNRFAEFRSIFPKQRAGSWEKAEVAYGKALKRAPAEQIIAGVKKYAISEEVSKGFAKGAAAWLTDDRWTTDYSTRAQQNNFNQPNQRPSTPVKSRKIVI